MSRKLVEEELEQIYVSDWFDGCSLEDLKFNIKELEEKYEGKYSNLRIAMSVSRYDDDESFFLRGSRPETDEEYKKRTAAAKRARERRAKEKKAESERREQRERAELERLMKKYGKEQA